MPAFAWLVLIPFVVAVATITVGYVLRGKPGSDAAAMHLASSMGPASWDFTRSWASNITVIGSVLSAVLAQATVSGRGSSCLTQSEYEAASGFWLVVILTAPAVYNFWRDVEPPSDTSPGITTFHGFVGGFLCASAFTTFAVLGQLGTLGLLFRDLNKQGTLPFAATFCIWILLALIVLGLLFYAFRNTGLTLKYQRLTQERREYVREAIDAHARQRRMAAARRAGGDTSKNRPFAEQTVYDPAAEEARLHRMRAELVPRGDARWALF